MLDHSRFRIRDLAFGISNSIIPCSMVRLMAGRVASTSMPLFAAIGTEDSETISADESSANLFEVSKGGAV